MDSDLALILGIGLVALSLLSLLSAFSERRPPRIPGLVLLIGAGLATYAVASKPGGYRIEQLPEVFFSVLGRFI